MRTPRCVACGYPFIRSDDLQLHPFGELVCGQCARMAFDAAIGCMRHAFFDRIGKTTRPIRAAGKQ